MNFLKNKNAKKSLIFMLITMCIAIVLIVVETKYINDKYNKITNSAILSIVNEVQVKYPNVDDKDIIKVLNGKKEYDGSILQKYGYDESKSFIVEIANEQNKTILLNTCTIIFICLLFVGLYLVYLRKQSKKLKDINEYLREINNKNYMLKIDENGNDELSKLQNQLYKTTVLLKQTAKNNEKEKLMLSNSLADISHQLKTPLTSIAIMLDNINDNPNMDSNTKTYFIKEIMKQIDWVNSLAVSLLKVAKFDSGTIKLKKEKIEVDKLINSVISNLSIQLDIKDIQVVLKITKGTFLGDYKWQQEALTNILKNAIEHSSEHSKIYIEVEDTNLFVKIIIKDEGEGISKEDIKHIFERFYKSKTSSANSVGIGLNLAKTIIEKENGSISVSSESKKGATFVIKYLKV